MVIVAVVMPYFMVIYVVYLLLFPLRFLLAMIIMRYFNDSNLLLVRFLRRKKKSELQQIYRELVLDFHLDYMTEYLLMSFDKETLISRIIYI